MNSLNKTFLPTKDYKNRNWFIIDCEGQKLGRLATILAALLRGKVKPHYHPSISRQDLLLSRMSVSRDLPIGSGLVIFLLGIHLTRRQIRSWFP